MNKISEAIELVIIVRNTSDRTRLFSAFNLDTLIPIYDTEWDIGPCPGFDNSHFEIESGDSHTNYKIILRHLKDAEGLKVVSIKMFASEPQKNIPISISKIDDRGATLKRRAQIFPLREAWTPNTSFSVKVLPRETIVLSLILWPNE